MVITGTATKLIKHDRYVQVLHEKLESSYDEIQTNVTLYSKKNRKIGEIDLIAFREDTCDVFEVKCSYRPVKAKKQIKRIVRLVPSVKRAYFYCGESGVIEKII